MLRSRSFYARRQPRESAEIPWRPGSHEHVMVERHRVGKTASSCRAAFLGGFRCFRGDWRSILENSRGPKCASVNRGQDAAVELLDASCISLLWLISLLTRYSRKTRSQNVARTDKNSLRSKGRPATRRCRSAYPRRCRSIAASSPRNYQAALAGIVMVKKFFVCRSRSFSTA